MQFVLQCIYYNKCRAQTFFIQVPIGYASFQADLVNVNVRIWLLKNVKSMQQIFHPL